MDIGHDIALIDIDIDWLAIKNNNQQELRKESSTNEKSLPMDVNSILICPCITELNNSRQNLR